jgi:nitrogen-specific signal transduction histidine kinase
VTVSVCRPSGVAAAAGQRPGSWVTTTRGGIAADAGGVNGRKFRLVVEDNGPGIDPSLGNAIYQANTTTKANGHGLGLALVRGVMLAHEGYVSHDRSDLGGARFLCGIPMSVDAAREANRADPGGR